jgi:molecular chaperone IbpA
MTKITAMDLNPFYRNSIGVDRLFDRILNQIDTAGNTNYPPYNIVQINEDEYMISLAVAGFGLDNLSVTKDKKFLIIEGKEYQSDSEKIVPNYLHKGISNRDFRREFQLADHVEITNAHLELGILSVHLKREVPEEAKPKAIAITYTA